MSRDAREWFRQGSRLLVQRDDLQKSVDLQKAQLGGLNDQIKDNRKQIAKEQTELNTRQRALDEKQSRIAVLDQDLKGRDKRLDAANVLLEKTKVDLAGSQRRLEDQRRRLVALRRDADIAQAQARSAQTLFKSTQTMLVTVRRTLRDAQAALRVAKKNTKFNVDQGNLIAMKSQETYKENLRLTEEVQNRQLQIVQLKKDAADLIDQRDVAEAQSNEAQARYTAIQNDLKKADQELTETQAALQSVLNSGFKTSRTEALTYRRGEEVARIVVPAESNVEATRNILASLLRTSRIDASERGAKGHRGFEAADIVDRKDPQTGEVADADTLKRALVANLAGRTEDQVLVATSSLNAFDGEPVSLDLMAMPNPVVYHRNDTIAETRIDGAQPEAKILAQLSDFMNGELRQRARKDRMVPRAGTAAPYGEPSAANVWSALQSVRRAGRTVRVSAVAEDDIRAADPLRLGFRVH